MHFDLSKPQKLLQESARTFLKRECPVGRVRELMATDTGYDEDLWKSMAEQGWTGLMIAEEASGLGLGVVELVALAEEMGRACAISPLMTATWGGTLIAACESGPLRHRDLEDIAAGSGRPAIALLETEPSWDPADVRLALQPVEGGHQLQGTKTFVVDAAIATFILCIARKENSLAIVRVPIDRGGITIEATPGFDSTRKLYRLSFDQTKITEEDVLAEGQSAEKALERSIQIGTVMACGELVGATQWMLETTVEYAKSRQQFGQPIGSFQAVQHQCADMLLMIESARSAAYYAAWALTENDPNTQHAVSMAKAYCSDAGREVGDRAVQVHGGVGFTWEHDLHLYYKRAKSNELLFGDATFHRERLASLILDDGDGGSDD